MKLLSRWLVMVGLVLWVSPHAFATDVISSTFDTTAEGWTATGAAVTQEKTGGNPGGFLKIADTDTDTVEVYPPFKFKGNLSAFDGGLLTYEVKVFVPTTPLTSVGSGFGRIQLEGGGSNATFDYTPDPPVPGTASWKAYTVPMTAAAWRTTEDNWQVVLSNVTNLHIILEPQNGGTVGLDNVRLAPAGAIPTGLVEFEQAGFSIETLDSYIPFPDVLCDEGFAADRKGNVYFTRTLGPIFGIMQTSAKGLTTLIARSGLPQGYASSSPCGLDFDTQNRMVLGIQLRSNTGNTRQTVVRIKGFH